MKRVLDAIHEKLTIKKTQPAGQDGEDGKAFAAPGSYAEGGKGGKADFGQGGKGGDAIVMGKGGVAIDGITARDTIIEIQAERIAFLEMALENAKYKISQLEMDHAELSGLDAKCTALSIENAQLRYQIKHGMGSGGDGGAAGEPGKPGK
jgi:hypothetical protein